VADLRAFRDEVREWLLENAPASLRGAASGSAIEGYWGGRKVEEADLDRKLWCERMAARGWTAPTWPGEYAGGGLSAEEAKVLREEMKRLELPPPLIGFGLTMIGPTLLQFGSEEQKREHLTRIVRGEIRWCQGYSEPDAGSDLAALKTRAERDGDDFIITGQKVWTSYADRSDWMFLLVRTDPSVKKQAGITFLLMDLDQPGVELRPIQLISGASPFCEAFLEDVRVPVKNVVSKINGGWTVAKALLSYERNMIAEAFGTASDTAPGPHRSLAAWARRYLDEEKGCIADASIRHRIAQTEMDTRCLALTLQRARDSAKAGHAPGAESSIFKVYGTELNQSRQELMVSVAGPRALGWEGAGFEPDELAVTRSWLRSRGNSIEGGTSEIQLNIIAKRVLELPD
jgi:acyl-CoA dehydrogenase